MATLTLTFRFGEGTDEPSRADLERAVAEIFEETNSACSEGDYAEHPNAWLEHGEATNDGRWSVTTLDLYRGGQMRFVKYADQDDAGPEFELTLKVDRGAALRLWELLLRGEITRIRSEPWDQT